MGRKQHGKKKIQETFQEQEMREALVRCMYNSRDSSKRFIFEEKLKQDFWLQYPVERIRTFAEYGSSNIEKIKRKFLCVLSIAIISSWAGLRRFLPVFVNEDLHDGKLFFDKDQLEHMGDGVEAFLIDQYAFKPAIIGSKQTKYIQQVESKYRLPLLDAEDCIGSGGFSQVTKAQIAPGGLELRYDDLSPFRNDKVIVTPPLFI